MLRLPGIRLLILLAVLLAALTPVYTLAQDDPNEVHLGDVARNLRKKAPTGEQVIDDDNLPQMMEQAESHHNAGSSLRFLMAGESKGFQVSVPDATCSLSFTPSVKSLLSSQYSQMQLPPGEIARLTGQATIEGDALTIPIFNGTDWHVSELAVALTVIRKSGSRAFSLGDPLGDALTGGADSSTAADPLQQVRPEKKPDETMIYRMRAASPPWERTRFSAPLDLDLAPGDEWHWAIVEAKGYPPESYSKEAAQSTAKATPAVPANTSFPALAAPLDEPSPSSAVVPQ